MLLAIGVLLDASFIINPLIGALSCGATYMLAQSLAGQKQARIAALLCLLSPFILMMSAEFMNHSTALLSATSFLACFLLAWQRLCSLCVACRFCYWRMYDNAPAYIYRRFSAGYHKWRASTNSQRI